MDFLKQNKIAIFDPFTKKEFEHGLVRKTLNRFLNKKKASSKFCFDLFLLHNTGDEDDSYFDFLYTFENHPNVDKVFIINENIEKKDDVYYKESVLEYDGEKLHFKKNSCPKHLPELGGTSGPNLSFYNAIEILIDNPNYDYENFFMIENDSFPITDFWFDKIFEFCNKEDNDFLVAGSKYKGHQKWHHILDYKDHLNGVAIYKNNSKLLTFMMESKEYNKKMVTESNWCVNFDVAYDKFSKTPRGAELTNNQKLLVNTDFITNISDPLDSYISEKDILKMEPNTFIVHQKEFESLDPRRTPYYPKFNLEDFNKKSKSISEAEDIIVSDPNFSFVSRASSNLVSENFRNKTCFFLRAPRHAGNYMLQYIRKNLFHYCSELGKISYFFKIDLNEKSACDVFCCADSLILNRNFSANFNLSPNNRITFEDLKELKEDGLLDILYVSTDPFQDEVSAREVIYEFQKISEEIIYHTLLRNCFDKSKSTSKSGDKNNYIKYLDSSAMPDSWTIRSLCNLDFSREIEYFHYEHACDILENFIIKDISYAKELADEVLNKAFGLRDVNPFIEEEYYMKSKEKADIDINELSNFKSTQNENITIEEIFKGRTYFDQKLYNKFIKS